MPIQPKLVQFSQPHPEPPPEFTPTSVSSPESTGRVLRDPPVPGLDSTHPKLQGQHEFSIVRALQGQRFVQAHIALAQESGRADGRTADALTALGVEDAGRELANVRIGTEEGEGFFPDGIDRVGHDAAPAFFLVDAEHDLARGFRRFLPDLSTWQWAVCGNFR